MFSRFCNLCHKTANTQFVQFQRFYRKGSRGKTKSNVSRIKAPINVEEKTPIIVCRRKEFNFYEGQIYPKYMPIPLASKGWHHYKSKGDYFFVYPPTTVTKEAYNNKLDEINSFSSFGLNPKLVETLKRYSITQPLKIQMEVIPKIMHGANTVISAETGCGKTFAYLVPMIDQILRWKTLVTETRYNTPLGLIVVPTRELAFQLGFEAKKICQYLNIDTKTIIGGKTKKIMLDPPVDTVDLLVGSFGVMSKLTTTNIYKLDMVKHIVLDEADALFDETFEDKLKVFLKKIPIGFMQGIDRNELPKGVQFTLASATMPSRMSEVLEDIVNVNSLVHINSEKLHHILVPQKFVRVGPADKPTELLKYIKPKVANKESVIVFTNDNTTCNWVSMFLDSNNIQTVHMNGTMPVYMRQGKYASFKSGRCKVLCTTNAGSRGLDTITVRHVLNFEFPFATADYIHRCGRTGRIGSAKDCRVTNFISTREDVGLVWKIERAVRKMKPIPICDIHSTREDDIFDTPSHKENVEEINEPIEFNIPY